MAGEVLGGLSHGLESGQSGGVVVVGSFLLAVEGSLLDFSEVMSGLISGVMI